MSCISCLIFRRQERKVGQNIFDNLASLLFSPRPPLCHFIPPPPYSSSFLHLLPSPLLSYSSSTSTSSSLSSSFSPSSSSSFSSSVVSASRSLLLGHSPLPEIEKHNNAEQNWPVFFCPQLKLNPNLPWRIGGRP